MPLHFSVLASGSAGNASLLEADGFGVLIDAGLDASAIKIISHGETDLLVHTADDTFEPRNRRVDISVR